MPDHTWSSKQKTAQKQTPQLETPNCWRAFHSIHAWIREFSWGRGGYFYLIAGWRTKHILQRAALESTAVYWSMPNVYTTKLAL